MRLVYNDVTLQDWSVDAAVNASDFFHAAIMKAAEQVVKEAMEDEDTQLQFPAEWGDLGDGYSKTKLKDPLELYLRVSITEDFDTDPIYQFNLRHALRHVLQEGFCGNHVDQGIKEISQALKSLAEDLDRCMGKNN